MIIFRRRLILWLIKAYFKKWGRSIIVFLTIGLLVFFALRILIRVIPSTFPFIQRETIGMAGAYRIDNLPHAILKKVGRGLTSVSYDGTVKPDIAEAWEIGDNGREYTFFLRRDSYFSDGTPLTSKNITYSFSDASITRSDDYTIKFRLKDAYSPFPVTVSRPIFKKNFVGLGEYSIKSIKFNGDFITSIDLVSKKENKKVVKYQFFPTEDAVKTAFVMGEVSKISGIHDATFKKTKLNSFKSTTAKRVLNDQQLITLFYNTQDKVLSEKRVREALSYTIPDVFPLGERNPGPFSSSSWADRERNIHLQDIEHAKNLLDASESATGSSNLNFVIKTLPQYRQTAKILEKSFKKIGVNIKVEVVEAIPLNFQIFLGNINLAKDPDQYVLWHSEQNNNISGYKNLRIDKLLEDGRKTIDINERKKIYSDFQKYILDDPPASFLYFPYTYEISRN